MFKIKEIKNIIQKVIRDLNEIQISDIPNKEFQIAVRDMLTEVKKAMHEQSENFNKEYNEVHKRKNGAEENNN